MHIVHNCSNTRGYKGRSRCATPKYSFDHEWDSKKEHHVGMWTPFLFSYNSREKSAFLDIYGSDEVPSLQTICLQMLQIHIIRTAEISWHITESQHPTKQAAANAAIDYLLEQVVCKCPPVFLNKICTTILDCIEYLLPDPILMERFVNLLVHANIKKLDLTTRPRSLQRAVYSRLEQLTHLEVLVIEKCRYYQSPVPYPVEEFVLKGVKNMSNLQKITLHDRCTDDIVISVVKHCPKLKALDVFRSHCVTNSCTKHLAKCKHLEDINLTETSVTSDGLYKIIMGVPTLNRIGTFQDIWELLGSLHERNVVLNLTQVKDGLKCKDLEVLESCPMLTYLHIDCLSFHKSIIPIAKLRHLTELMVDYGDFIDNGVKEYLKLKGHTLRRLTLRSCSNVEEETIRSLCPNLRSLEVTRVPPAQIVIINRAFTRKRYRFLHDACVLLAVFLFLAILTIFFISFGKR